MVSERLLKADFTVFQIHHFDLGSGQVIGIMGGLLGAAQYEKLADNPGRAMDGMKVQLWAHIVIIIFIIMGNIGYFAARRRQKREGGL